MKYAIPIHFFKRLFSTLLPSNKIEIAVFGFSFIILGFMASTIAIDYRIVYDHRIPWDAYFSFDNKAIVQSGGSYERHPLSNYLFFCIRKMAYFFSNGQSDSIFRLVLVFFTVLSTSLSITVVFKYLRNIILLPISISLLLTVFYTLTSSVLVLSFTPENFTFSLLFLVIYFYYASSKIDSDKGFSALSLVTATVFIGGLTITNIVKVFIPIFFLKKMFSSRTFFMKTLGKCALAIFIFVSLFLYRLNFKFDSIFTKSTQQYEKFSNIDSTSYLESVFSYFFGSPLLFSSFTMTDRHNMKGFYYKALYMDYYSSWFLYGVVLVVLTLCMYSIIRNRKNRLVWILFFSFLTDIMIHVFLKFGLHTAFIYGGHFVFVYPLLLGWLFSSFRKNKLVITGLSTLVFLLTLFMFINNYYRLKEFFDFLQMYYQ